MRVRAQRRRFAHMCASRDQAADPVSRQSAQRLMAAKASLAVRLQRARGARHYRRRIGLAKQFEIWQLKRLAHTLSLMKRESRGKQEMRILETDFFGWLTCQTALTL